MRWSALLTQNGALQGLMSKFAQSGHGDIFLVVGRHDDNKPVSPDQIHKCPWLEPGAGLAAKLGVDPSHASGFLAEYPPKDRR